MANIFDYLKEMGAVSIYDQEFGELDVLALTELTYLSFDGLGLEEVQPQPERRLVEIVDQLPRIPSMLTTRERLELADRLAQTTRFKNIKLLGYRNDVDRDLEKQFAVLTYRLSLNTYLVVFRGTDASVIGWKEDFHMTYMDHIPAQKSALAYLEEMMTRYPKARFLVAGHSKGGNLAIYAASFLPSSLQARLAGIYSYDAPGLNQALVTLEGYQACADKIHRYIPQGSIVGMMLEVPEPAQIVYSKALGGIAQHNTFTWQIEAQHFVYLDQTTADSQQMDKTFKNWVQEVPDEELKDFFDTFFGLILDAGIESIDDLTKFENRSKVGGVIQNARMLDPKKQEMMLRLGRQLIDTRYQMWRQDQDLPDFWNRWFPAEK